MKIKKLFALILSLFFVSSGLVGCKNSGQENNPGTQVEEEFNVVVDSTITNGTVVPDKLKAKYKEIVTLTVTPNEGYKLKKNSLLCNGDYVEDNQFEMPKEDAHITAEFEKVSYKISIGSLENGEIAVNKRKANFGDLIEVYITPAVGYKLEEGSLKYDDTPITNNAFTMPAKDITITGNFIVNTDANIGNLTIGTNTYNTTSGFDLNKDNSTDRTVRVDSDSQEYAFLKNSVGNNVYAKTFINVHGKDENDAYPRFGLAMINENDDALIFNVEGSNNLTGQQSRVETADYIRSGSYCDNFVWGAYMMKNNVGSYTGENKMLFEIIKYDGYVYFMINEILVGYREFKGFDNDSKVCVALVTMATHATFTEYEATTDLDFIKSKVPFDTTDMKLGSVTLNNNLFASTAGFDLSSDHATNRKASVAVDGQQFAFFRGVAGKTIYAKASINVTGKKAGEAYPRFGLSLINSSRSTIIFNVEGSNELTGQQSRVEMGTYNLNGYVEGFTWGKYMFANNVGAYTGENVLTFEIIKYGSKIAFLINGNEVGKEEVAGFGENDECVVALTTFETHATFTNYEATSNSEEVAKHVSLS